MCRNSVEEKIVGVARAKLRHGQRYLGPNIKGGTPSQRHHESSTNASAIHQRLYCIDSNPGRCVRAFVSGS